MGSLDCHPHVVQAEGGSRAFHNTHKPIRHRNGLKQCPGEQCLWYGRYEGKPVYMVVQVNDFLVCSSCAWFKKRIDYMRVGSIEIKAMSLASKQSADLGTALFRQAPMPRQLWTDASWIASVKSLGR